MIYPSVPENEARRLSSLYEFNILDTLSEHDYEDITAMAAAICKTPIALITLVDRDRQWFKSNRGLNVTETKRDYAFCAHAINSPKEPFIVEDSTKDERFKDNPLVTGEPHVIFYTGVPLVTSLGDSIGTLCVIDNTPRKLSDEQLAALKVLSNHVMSLLQLRKTNTEMQKIQDELIKRNEELEQFASVLSHDIKAPLSGILLSSDLLSTQLEQDQSSRGSKLALNIKNAANTIVSLVNGILEYYKTNNTDSNRQTIILPDFFEMLIPMLDSGKELSITYSQERTGIFFNQTLLQQIFLNLLGNSIRYNNNKVVEVKIDFWEDIQNYFFSVKDNGIGIALEDQEKIFTLFTSLKQKKRYSASGYGIGLATIKRILEKNGGDIKVFSENGRGATFTFSLRKNYGEI